jgi:hypothetical protein
VLVAGGEEAGLMITCNLCQVAVHQHCYGRDLSEVDDPNLSWRCERCEELLRRRMYPSNIRCRYCDELSGLMRKLKDGTWVHFTCINFFPELYPNQSVE